MKLFPHKITIAASAPLHQISNTLGVKSHHGSEIREKDGMLYVKGLSLTKILSLVSPAARGKLRQQQDEAVQIIAEKIKAEYGIETANDMQEKRSQSRGELSDVIAKAVVTNAMEEMDLDSLFASRRTGLLDHDLKQAMFDLAHSQAKELNPELTASERKQAIKNFLLREVILHLSGDKFTQNQRNDVDYLCKHLPSSCEPPDAAVMLGIYNCVIAKSHPQPEELAPYVTQGRTLLKEHQARCATAKATGGVDLLMVRRPK